MQFKIMKLKFQFRITWLNKGIIMQSGFLATDNEETGIKAKFAVCIKAVSVIFYQIYLNTSETMYSVLLGFSQSRSMN